METYKYKAKDEFSNGWLYGQGFYVDPDNDVGYIANGINDYARVDKDTVCQFVGQAYNKNDKRMNIDLYENDIIRALSGFAVWVEGPIVYDQRTKMYRVEGHSFVEFTDITIHGNIFDDQMIKSINPANDNTL